MTPALSALVLGLACSLNAQVDPELLSGIRARSIGPAGMSGRVASIDALITNPQVIYVGAATGGVWKSTDGAVTFQPIFDDQPVAAIGAVRICQENPDVVWVGTGEGNPRNSASVGNGIYRSLDGGRTWTHLGLEKTERIHRIVLDPRDRDVAYVAALGTSWGENPERGVFKTVDGGQTWDKILYVDEKTGAADLVMDPNNPDKILAAMWQHRRWPHFFESGGPGSGLHVTWDGGKNWRRLTEEDGLPACDLGRIGVAIAPSTPATIYALVEAKNSALLRSDDGGDTWRIVNREPGVANRPFYYADLRVDPERPDRVYSLESTLKVSDDGGKSFSTISQGVHPDHHALWIHPNDGNLLIEGNDGGVVISRDRGATWRFITTLPLAQFYHLDVDMEVPYNVYGGLQDNGSWRGPSSVWENGGIRNHHWYEVGFGDGFRTLADPENAGIGYAMSQQGFVHRWNFETGERKRIRPAAADVPLRFNWNAGIAIDPVDPATLYFGSQFVHRSRDRGETWELISDDLTTNNPDWQKQDESGGLTLDVTGAENYTTITVIAPSPIVAHTHEDHRHAQDVLWVGTDDGRIHVTRDQGRSWTSVEGNVPDLPANTWVPHIEPSRFDPAAAYAVFDDHRRANWTTYVYKTEDYGQTWRSIATDQLRGYALTLAQDTLEKNLLFLGTEFGLWFTLDGGERWLRFEHGFPTVSTMALEVHERDQDLVIGTHGRAAYVVDDIRPLRGLTAEITSKPLHLFEVAVAQQYRIKQTGASRFPAAGEFRGENREYGALVTFVVNGDELPHPEDAKSRKATRDAEADAEEEEGKRPVVEVEVRNPRDEVVCTFEREVVRGLNRFTWNLRRDEFRRPRDPRDRPPEGSGPRGPEVPAGLYRIKLSFGEHEAEKIMRVVADPRVAVSDADRKAKWQAILLAGSWQELLADCMERVGDTRADISTVQRKLKAVRDQHDGDDKPHEDLLTASKELQKSLDTLETTLKGAPDLQGIGPRNHVAYKVRNAFGSLPSSWDAPTAAQLRNMEIARTALEEALVEVNRVFAEDVARFREMVAGAGIALFPPHQELRLPN